MSLNEILRSFTQDGELPVFVQRAGVWAVRSKWALLGGTGLLLFLPIRFLLPSWLLEQFRLFPDLAVSPVTQAHLGDVNFWGGQIVSLLIVTTVTWLMLNSRQVWENGLLNFLFIATWQKMAFKHFMLGSLQDNVFMFLSRQLTMVFTGLFLPDYNQAPTLDNVSWPRWFLDSRMCTAWYMLTASLWYGNKIGLFRPPVRFAWLVSFAAFLLHVFGVGTLRMYPVLNRSGVSLPVAIFSLLFRFPLVVTALGAAAVWPMLIMGSRLKGHNGRSFVHILSLYVLHVLSVMWANVAGQSVGEKLISMDHEWRIDLNFGVSLGIRFLLLAIIAVVMYVGACVAQP